MIIDNKHAQISLEFNLLITDPDKAIMKEESKSGRSSNKCLLKLLIHS